MLRWDDVDRTAGELRLSDSKSGPRRVPLTPAVERVLARIPRADGNPWVIAGEKRGDRLRRIDPLWNRLRARRAERPAASRPPSLLCFAGAGDRREPVGDLHTPNERRDRLSAARGERKRVTAFRVGRRSRPGRHSVPSKSAGISRPRKAYERAETRRLPAALRFPLELVPALVCLRRQLGKPLSRQVANESRRREGRIAVRLPQGAQHAKRFGGIEIERPGQKPVGVDRLDIELPDDLGRKVGQVVGENILRAAADRRRQDVAVVRIRKFERPDQRLVSGDQRLRKMLAYGMPLGANTPFKMRLLFEEVQRPLVENPFGPSRPEQSGVMEAQENVSLAKRKQDVRIQQGDTTVRELFQDASNS